LAYQLTKIAASDKKYSILNDVAEKMRGSTKDFFKIYLHHLNELLDEMMLDTIYVLSPLPKFVKHENNVQRKLELRNIKKSSLLDHEFGLPSDVQ
jgi:hypothetical protein